MLPKPPRVPGPCPTDGTDVWLCEGECPLYSWDCCGVDDEPRLYDRLDQYDRLPDERPLESQGANDFACAVPEASVCGLIMPGVVEPGAAQSRGGSNA